MAFKMKGSSYKMGGHKTKSTMAYMKSPLEQAKPDYPDIDKDGNTTESMKQAAADKKSSALKDKKFHKKNSTKEDKVGVLDHNIKHSDNIWNENHEVNTKEDRTQRKLSMDTPAIEDRFEDDAPTTMKSPVKDIKKVPKASENINDNQMALNHNKLHEEGKDHEDLTKSTYKFPGKAPTEMKKSGFKMKGFSGFQESASPMKKMEIEIDGEVVTPEEYRDYVKGADKIAKDQMKASQGWTDDKMQASLKEAYGDDFLTEKEWVLKKYPGTYWDGETLRMKSDQSTVGKAYQAEYSDYVQPYNEKLAETKGEEYETYLGGRKGGAEHGYLRAGGVTLTGKDLLNSLQGEFQQAMLDGSLKGRGTYGQDMTYDQWLKAEGHEDIASEAKEFERYKTETGTSGEEALKGFRSQAMDAETE